MNALVLVLISIAIFFIAYVSYGAWLAKQWGVDDGRKTPAHTKGDGVDYVPAKSPVLLGHHFASIAGAGPIVGPITAAIFGWVPVLLWIIIGSIFFGGVQDFGSLFASIRHNGKSIGEVIEINMGKKGKKLFAIFAWLTLLLVVAAFANIVANTFVSVPEAATASVLFILLAIVFGFAVYRQGVSLGIGSVIGVILLFVCIALGNMFPLELSRNAWIVILLGYIFIASVTPVWILLQPRDYLNSYLLYIMMAGAVIGLIITRPALELAPVTGFNVGGQWMFPMLFVTVACGAISGFHSLVGSGTSAKQLDKESDAKIVGYGGMLIEGVLAVIAIITAAYIGHDKLAALLNNGGPVNVFSDGIGTFMTSFGISFTVGKSFVALAVSAFALTSLDTGTRLGRFILQEFFYEEGAASQHPLTNMYTATALTVVVGGLLAITSWAKIWPVFGSANQLLAALALMAVAVWLKKTGKNYKMFIIPMVFMFAATLLALILLIKTNLGPEGSLILVVFPVLLFILAIILAYQGYHIMKEIDTKKITKV
ncbi:carbon starvation CstA family protein [Clostridium formicaceticum]|uniref:Carbon starvation protein A n=1 Tax=Clostridium formicaceticum TaxID=1497 RepID=A0AAC9RNV7_9CLOT|nr:carbon starvation protein A [Clostridium formicaceticum]AOY75010.1 carbon starvation protein A [Clostridium formicaceticum]ARE89426.1 Carbon starvation protein A [Clostridium formicaceticum]